MHGSQSFPRKRLNALGFGRRKPAFFPHVVDEEILRDHILTAEKQYAVRPFTVSPGSARFLIIAFKVFGHVVVNDISDVRLVDAHAKGVCRHHHRLFVC